MSNCGNNASFTPAPECVFPEGTLEITENGIFDVTEYANADVNVSGGGASNVVTGTFTAGNGNGTQLIDIPYTGNGYPLYGLIYIDGGYYQSGNADWDNLAHRYPAGACAFMKGQFSTAPTYTTSGVNNIGAVFAVRKSSGSDATSFDVNGGSSNLFTTTNAGNGTSNFLKFKTDKQMQIYHFSSDTRSGFMQNTTYKYIIFYSS